MSMFKNLLSKTIYRDLTTSGRFEKCYNYVSLLGRVGSPPKVGKNTISNPEYKRNYQMSDEIVVFSLGTSRYQGRSEDGETHATTDWHRVCVENPYLIATVKQFVEKGDRLLVSGSICYNTIQDEKNNERTVSYILAKEVVFLGRSKKLEEEKAIAE